MKYTVMECHFGYAVVLDEEGRFIKVANMGYQVGQTVDRVVEMNLPETTAEETAPPAEKTKRKIPFRRWISFVAAACLIFVILPSVIIPRAAVASVYMSINPEVRIDINRKDIVVGLEGVNDDGIALLQDYDYKNKHIDLVLDELVDLAIEKEYLQEGGKVTISLDGDEEWVVAHGDAIGNKLDEHLVEKIAVDVEVTDKKTQKVIRHGRHHKYDDDDDDDDDDIDDDDDNFDEDDDEFDDDFDDDHDTSGYHGKEDDEDHHDIDDDDTDDEDDDDDSDDDDDDDDSDDLHQSRPKDVFEESNIPR